MTLETVTDILAGFIGNVLIARAMGPVRLGYYVLISWISSVAGKLGVGGVATAERKYMAEYIGRGELATAKTIFLKALRAQLLLGTILTCIGLVVASQFAEPSYRSAAILLVLSILPAMLVSVPSQAFNAAENAAANVPGALVANIIFLVGVLTSLGFGWGLTGIAASFLLMRSGECVVRFAACLRWLRPFPAAPIEGELVRRMVAFALRGTVLTVMMTFLLDRSELLFLEFFRDDVREISYYSLAFGISERVTLFILIFGNAVGATLLAQYGRDASRLGSTLRTSHRYIALLAMPMNIGLAILSGPIISLVYGSDYAPTAPVLACVALFAVPKAFAEPNHRALEASGYQKFVLGYAFVAAVLNLGLDWLLIPRFGPMGAAIANGTAQLVAVIALLRKSSEALKLNDTPAYYVRLAGCSAVMGAVVWLVTSSLPAIPALLVGVPCGVVVFMAGLRLGKVLEAEDRERLGSLRNRLPSRIGSWFDWSLAALIPERAAKPGSP